MKYSLFFLFVVSFVMIDNAMCKECIQAACEKECEDKRRETGICALTAEGDVCQCSAKECTQGGCHKECLDKGHEAGICGLAADDDVCQCIPRNRFQERGF